MEGPRIDCVKVCLLLQSSSHHISLSFGPWPIYIAAKHLVSKICINKQHNRINKPEVATLKSVYQIEWRLSVIYANVSVKVCVICILGHNVCVWRHVALSLSTEPESSHK